MVFLKYVGRVRLVAVVEEIVEEASVEDMGGGVTGEEDVVAVEGWLVGESVGMVA